MTYSGWDACGVRGSSSLVRKDAGASQRKEPGDDVRTDRGVRLKSLSVNDCFRDFRVSNRTAWLGAHQPADTIARTTVTPWNRSLGSRRVERPLWVGSGPSPTPSVALSTVPRTAP